MKPYSKLTKEELHNLKEQLEKQYEEVKKKGLNLDMSRGKPSKAQLDLSPETPVFLPYPYQAPFHKAGH